MNQLEISEVTTAIEAATQGVTAAFRAIAVGTVRSTATAEMHNAARDFRDAAERLDRVRGVVERHATEEEPDSRYAEKPLGVPEAKPVAKPEPDPVLQGAKAVMAPRLAASVANLLCVVDHLLEATPAHRTDGHDVIRTEAGDVLRTFNELTSAGMPVPEPGVASAPLRERHPLEALIDEAEVRLITYTQALATKIRVLNERVTKAEAEDAHMHGEIHGVAKVQVEFETRTDQLANQIVSQERGLAGQRRQTQHLGARLSTVEGTLRSLASQTQSSLLAIRDRLGEAEKAISGYVPRRIKETDAPDRGGE